jgi:hypothetical protein
MRMGKIMPDGSRDCEIIMEQLREIRDMHIAHSSEVKAEIRMIKETLEKIDTIEASIEHMRIQDARQQGQFDGAIWTLARIGAVVTLLFAGIGWLTTGGGWQWIKDHI